MILELILTPIFNFINIILIPFDGITFVFRTDVFSTVMQYLNVVFYVLPIDNFIPIIGFMIALMGLRIVIALLKTIWGILPFI